MRPVRALVLTGIHSLSPTVHSSLIPSLPPSLVQVCYANPAERARFIRCIYNLLNSSSAAVRYEAAGTLVTLSSTPTAIKAAAQCYIDLVVKESDNNVKLIVLDRLIALKEVPAHEKVLQVSSHWLPVLPSPTHLPLSLPPSPHQELVMDILRVLSSPDLEVRKKTLSLVLDLVNSRNVEEVRSGSTTLCLVT